MKNLLLLAFICLLGFYACKKDSDNNSKKIIGKWTRTKGIRLKSLNGVDSLIEAKDGFGADDYIQFNANGTGYSAFGIPGVGYANFTYKIVEDSLLTAPIGLNDIGFKIKTLTSKNLVLRIPLGATTVREDYYTK